MSLVSYAQNYEDVMLIRALCSVEQGFYIDVGAQDPVMDSVTKAFYEIGWRGINIEPVTYWFQLLVADRTHDNNLQIAVSDSPGQMTLFEVKGSGLSTTNSEFAARHAKNGHQISESVVDCVTLDEICKIHEVGEIHFLKIDCEGAEAAALRGLSLDRIRPWIILLEATEPNSQKPAYGEWESLLTERGYHFVYEDGLNRFYVADEHAELDPAFSHPPNVFDAFVRASEATARNDLKLAQNDLATFRDAQRTARIESENEKLCTKTGFLLSENERREVALVELRQLLVEADERETLGADLFRAERAQWEVELKHLRAEIERSEALSIEHQRLLDEAAEREAQSTTQIQAERAQWKVDLENFRGENSRCEATLIAQRRMLNEAAERDAQAIDSSLAERVQWEADLEHLRGESERLGESLVGQRRLREKSAEEVTSLVGEIEGLRIDATLLRSKNDRIEQHLVELDRELADKEVELSRSRADKSRMEELEFNLLERNERLLASRSEIDDLLRTKANLVEALEISSRELIIVSSEISISQQKSKNLLHDINQVFASRSWKITRPLRRIAGNLYLKKQGGGDSNGEVDDLESRYALTGNKVSVAIQESSKIEEVGQEDQTMVEEILLGKDVETITGLRNRVRHINSLKKP